MGNCMGTSRKKAFEDELRKNHELKKQNCQKLREMIVKKEREKEQARAEFEFMKKEFVIPKPEQEYLEKDVDKLVRTLELIIKDARRKLEEQSKAEVQNDLICRTEPLTRSREQLQDRPGPAGRGHQRLPAEPQAPFGPQGPFDQNPEDLQAVPGNEPLTPEPQEQRQDRGRPAQLLPPDPPRGLFEPPAGQAVGLPEEAGRELAGRGPGPETARARAADRGQVSGRQQADAADRPALPKGHYPRGPRLRVRQVQAGPSAEEKRPRPEGPDPERTGGAFSRKPRGQFRLGVQLRQELGQLRQSGFD